MTIRSIIEVDEERCNGCGACIPGCPEGALQVIDGKARLVSDLFCDGLGACIKECPRGAMKVIKREAEEYDEKKVMSNIVEHGENTVIAHLKHLDDHGEEDLLKQAIEYLKENDLEVPDYKRKPRDIEKDGCGCAGHSSDKDSDKGGCPGAKIMQFNADDTPSTSENQPTRSALTQWPVQSNLIPPHAPFLNRSHLLIAADCTAFTMPNFHSELLHGKKLIISCPKFDDIEKYTAKLTKMFEFNEIKSITVAIMEVPCCSSLHLAVKEAIKRSGKDIPLIIETVSIKGNLI